MSSNCFKCRKNTESKNSKIVKTKNERIMLLSKCATCDSKNQVLSKCKKLLLSSLGIRTPLSNILSVVPLLF